MNINRNRNPVRKYPQEIVEEASRLYASGFSREMVAKEMKLPESTVNNWMKSGRIVKRSHIDGVKLACQNGRFKGAAVWTATQRQQASKAALERIARDPSSHPNRRCAGIKMSYPERLVFDVLTNARIVFEHNPRVLRFYPDFVLGKTIIEIDGERWHNPEKDAKRDALLMEAGYRVLRFPAKQILKNPRLVLDFI